MTYTPPNAPVTQETLPTGRVEMVVRLKTYEQLGNHRSSLMRTNTEMGQWCADNLSQHVQVRHAVEFTGDNHLLTFANERDAALFRQKFNL